jgi:hypothetical protein
MLTGIIINIIYNLAFILIGCQVTSALGSRLNNYKIMYQIARNCRRLRSYIIIDALERRLLDFSTSKAGPQSKAVCMGFFVNKVALGQVFFHSLV